MSDNVYSETYKGYDIYITLDYEPEDPRHWDNVGTMVCWHRRYDLGDQQSKDDPETWLRNLLEMGDNDNPTWSIDQLLDRAREEYLILPLYLYDHSGISMSTINTYPFNDRWDAGQVGWIYCSKERAIKEWGKKNYTQDVAVRVFKCLTQEVATYNDYLTNNVYGYEITEKNDPEPIESCYGFYPSEGDSPAYKYCLEEARGTVDFLTKEQDEEGWRETTTQEAYE